jgi:unsaturated rhamnogalacturonyl hydrolase
MNRLSIIFFVLLFWLTAKSQTEKTVAEKMTVTAMNLWKDSMSLNGKSAKWIYDQALLNKAIEGTWYNTGNGDYFKYIQKQTDLFITEDGTIKTYKQDDYNIDNVLGGRVLLTLYKVTGKEKYFKAAKTLREQLKNHPRTSEGGFWHKKRYPYQMWLDGLYMAEPFYAEYANLVHDSAAFDDIANQFIWMEKHVRDAKTGLLYHAWDESKKERWSDSITGRSPHFWSRSMGWYAMALVDVLEQFPDNHPKKYELKQILLRLTEAIKDSRDAKTGVWWQVTDYPNKKGNYLEASASSMFVYAIAKSMRLGFIPKDYLSMVLFGFDGIQKQFVETKDGMTILNGTVGGCGLGGDPYRDGSYEYYIGEKIVVNDPKGLGAYILAANEMQILLSSYSVEGLVVKLDNYFNAEFKKDITGKMMPYHYQWNEKANSGFSLFGHVFNSYGFKTTELTEAPTAANLLDAAVYIVVDPDTKEETANPNYFEKKDIDNIYDWVKKGGILIVLHNDKGNAEFEHTNQLMQRFGIHFKEDSRNHVEGAYSDAASFKLVKNPIFKTAKKVYLKEISTLSLTKPAKPVLVDNKDTIIAVAQVGKGTVFAVGDPWFYNEYTDGRKLPAEYENFNAMHDLVKWIIEQIKKPVVDKKK